MHLLLVTGFLGSGKTSLIIPLAKSVVRSKRRVAILVNEIGEIGIDNQLMRQLDLNVWELLAGCICCTLSGDLVSTLQKLDADHAPTYGAPTYGAPDLVIVEPSGAADPRNVLTALPYYRGRPLASVRTIAILDPLRLPMLIEILTPLITSQIQHADLVVISKSDLASADEIAFARQMVQDLNPSVQVMRAHAQEELEPDLIAELAPWLS